MPIEAFMDGARRGGPAARGWDGPGSRRTALVSIGRPAGVLVAGWIGESLCSLCLVHTRRASRNASKSSSGTTGLPLPLSAGATIAPPSCVLAGCETGGGAERCWVGAPGARGREGSKGIARGMDS